MSFSLFDTLTKPTDTASALVSAANAFLPQMSRGKAIERNMARSIMTISFGGSDDQGVWSWRDCYDAIEVGNVLYARKIAPQIAKLEDDPANILSVLKSVSSLGLTHTKRSEDQIENDQFSTPLELGAVAALAAQIRPGDKVLEPSAGHGMMAVIAEALGGIVHLNELSDARFSVLEKLFKSSNRTKLNGKHLNNLLEDAGSFDVVLSNPPFTDIDDHIEAGMKSLADNGRLVAIVPTTYFAKKECLNKSLSYDVKAMIVFPKAAFYKHGTTVETGLLVIDRKPQSSPFPQVMYADELIDAAALAQSIDGRLNAKVREFRTIQRPISNATGAVRRSTRFAFLEKTSKLAYQDKPWTGETRDVGIYSAYQLSRVSFGSGREHPATLVESAAMATTPLPPVAYQPLLPQSVLDSSISEAQLEAVLYACQSHEKMLPVWVRLSENGEDYMISKPGDEGAKQLRQGFFVADGTGVGKGTTAAAIAMENIANGRDKVVFLSLNESLIEDLRRDVVMLGGRESDVVALSQFKAGADITMDRGILFCTYATMRQDGRGEKKSRLNQIIDWCGADFDGAIIFDEAHQMANAVSSKSDRGIKKGSKQGLKGVLLQAKLPSARVVYLSATGGTEAQNLSYAIRLGLWGSADAPFTDRHQFISAAEEGGCAFLELLCRELKARGLYIARMISFEGVEVDGLQHQLTDAEISIWNQWADAFKIIHQNVDAALEATGVTEEGKTQSGQAKAAAKSALASCSQRFFNSLLCGMKAPSIIKDIKNTTGQGWRYIVQIVSTNEATLERRLDETHPSSYNDLQIDLSPKDAVLEYLEHSFPTQEMEIFEDEEGKTMARPLLDANGRAVHNQEALKLKEELILSLQFLPSVIGCLDALIETFGTDRVAEVTGRKRRVIKVDDRYVLDKRPSNANLSETEAFNNGAKDILIFSQAGGTGRSYHADRRFTNQERRRHYLAEGGWRADNAIQGLGRSHRSNQVTPPMFIPVFTDVKGEKRFISTIARRLDSLGAISKGDRRSGSNQMFRAEDSLENEYANRARLSFFRAMATDQIACMTCDEFEARTGLELIDSEGQLKEAEDLPPLTRFLNRLLACRIEDQNALFDAFEERLHNILEEAAQSGAMDRGVEDLVAKKVVKTNSRVILKDEGGNETVIHTFDMLRPSIRTDLETAIDYCKNYGWTAVVNKRSGRSALAKKGTMTTGSDDLLVECVRMMRPVGKRDIMPLATYEESSWTETDLNTWSRLWRDEFDNIPEFSSSTVHLASGLLLPIWKHMPKNSPRVRRIKADDGLSYLGRILEDQDLEVLLTKMGISSDRAMPTTAGEIARILTSNGRVKLTSGLTIKKSKIMDRDRIEIIGERSEYPTLRMMGVMIEVMAGTPRLFLTDKALIEAVLKKYPATEVNFG